MLNRVWYHECIWPAIYIFVFAFAYLYLCICIWYYEWFPPVAACMSVSDCNFWRLCSLASDPDPSCKSIELHLLNYPWLYLFSLSFYCLFLKTNALQWSKISGTLRISYVYLILIFIAADMRRNINWEFQISGKTSLELSQSWKYLALLPQLFRV